MELHFLLAWFQFQSDSESANPASEFYMSGKEGPTSFIRYSVPQHSLMRQAHIMKRQWGWSRGAPLVSVFQLIKMVNPAQDEKTTTTKPKKSNYREDRLLWFVGGRCVSQFWNNWDIFFKVIFSTFTSIYQVISHPQILQQTRADGWWWWPATSRTWSPTAHRGRWVYGTLISSMLSDALLHLQVGFQCFKGNS